MRIFGIPQIEDKKIALAAAIAYWIFRCRDKNKSPAMGLKTWEFFQSSLKNAAIPSKTLEDFIENLSVKLIVSCLKPREWTHIVSPVQTIQRIKENGEILEYDIDQANESLRFESWRSIILSLSPEGITDRHILQCYLKHPHIVAAYVRIRFEEDRAIGLEEIIEIETHEIE